MTSPGTTSRSRKPSLKKKLINAVYDFNAIQIKTREATSNKGAHDPSSSLLNEVARYTFDRKAYRDVMGIIWKRLDDQDKNWRHVYKSLVLLDHLVKNGNNKVVVKCCRNKVPRIEKLKDFQFIDKDGTDQGIFVRNKAEEFIALIKEEISQTKMNQKEAQQETMAVEQKEDKDECDGMDSCSVSGDSVTTGAACEPLSSATSYDSDDELFARPCCHSPLFGDADTFVDGIINYKRQDSVEKQQDTESGEQNSPNRLEELEKAIVEIKASNEYLKNQLSQTQQQLFDVQETNTNLQNELSLKLSNVQQANTHLQNQLCDLQKKYELLQVTLKDQLSLTQQQLLGVQSLMTCSRLWVVSHDQFTIGKEIGRGAWATVHETTFRGATVAAKSLHHLITAPKTKELFQREMEMALQCQHQNIVTFLGATLEGHPTILMELMDTNLRIAYEKGNIKDHQVLGILYDIANALHFLHTRPDPVIHRDVSSSNVLLKALYNGEWLAKLGDFGTARIQQQAGTPGPGAITYSAPEAADFTKHSPKMDVYSYGVLMLEALTKTHPFQMINSLKAKVKQQFPQYHEVITSCTKHQSSDRPTMYYVIEQLDRIKVVEP